MNRLTHRNENGEAEIIGIKNKDLYYGFMSKTEEDIIINAIERLEEYEKTGLPTVPIFPCVSAVETFGNDKQTDILIEEMAELTKALLKLRRRRHCVGNEICDVAEETADVLIMLVQLFHIHGEHFMDMVEFYINKKTNRLIDMIKQYPNEIKLNFEILGDNENE